MTEWITQHAWPLLASVFLKSFLVLALAALAALCLRRASAAARHLVWRLSLAALLLLPLLALLPLPAVLQVPLASRALLVPQDAPVVVSAPENPLPASPFGKGEGTEQPSSAPPLALRGRLGGGSSATGEPVIKPSALLPSWLCLIWLGGTILALLPTGLGLFGIARLTRQSLPLADGPAAHLLAALARDLGVSRPIHLIRGDAATPMTWGWLRPVILLPPGANEWPEDRLRAVLLHELAHIARADWPAQMTAYLACALYWPNPAVWLAARGARMESERACDDRVLLAGILAPDYARYLLDIARSLKGSPLPAVLPMAQKSGVEQRLRAILQPQRRQTMTTRKTFTVAALATCAILVPLAALRPVAQASAHALSATAAASVQEADGVTVQLIGVTDAGMSSGPGAAKRWWRPSGNILPKPLLHSPMRDFNIGVPSIIRAIAFRVTSSKNEPVSLKYQPAHSIGYSSDGSWIGKTTSTHELTETEIESSSGGYRIVDCAYPKAATECDIRVGVGTGPWNVTSDDDYLTRSMPDVTPSGIICVYSPVTMIKGGSTFTLSLTRRGKEVPLTDAEDVRIVAIDSHGHTWFPGDISEQEVFSLQQIQMHFALPPSAIKSIRIETRPYHWVTFHNVALQPRPSA